MSVSVLIRTPLIVDLGSIPKQCDLNLNELMTSAKPHVHIRSRPEALGRPELGKTLTQYRCKACLEDPTDGVPAQQKLIVPRLFLHSFCFLSSFFSTGLFLSAASMPVLPVAEEDEGSPNTGTAPGWQDSAA